MINIKASEKDRCKSDTVFLRTVLENEVEKVRDDLEISSPERITGLQGYCKALRDVINLLPE